MNFIRNKTTNERYARKADGENNSVLSKSMLDKTDNTDNSHLLASEDDTLLRTTFMGPKNGN